MFCVLCFVCFGALGRSLCFVFCVLAFARGTLLSRKRYALCFRFERYILFPTPPGCSCIRNWVWERQGQSPHRSLALLVISLLNTWRSVLIEVGSSEVNHTQTHPGWVPARSQLGPSGSGGWTFTHLTELLALGTPNNTPRNRVRGSKGSKPIPSVVP